MATEQPAIIGDSFVVGYRFQHYWGSSMARAFFFGELGAGLFLVSLYYHLLAGMIAGLVITGILKTYFHISHMGVPAKSWRAILRPDRAWVSRGLITIVMFTGFGGLYLLTGYYGWFGLDNSILLNIIKTIAILAALGVMAYHGFAMSDSTAISLWDSRLMPLISIGYALLGGAVLTSALGWFGFTAVSQAPVISLATLSLVLVLVNGALISSYLYAASQGSPGARVSTKLLLKGRFSKQFVVLVFVVGLLLPLLLLLMAPGQSLLIAIMVLSGYYAFRLLVLRAGVYEPIMNFDPGL